MDRTSTTLESSDLYTSFSYRASLRWNWDLLSAMVLLRGLGRLVSRFVGLCLGFMEMDTLVFS